MNERGTDPGLPTQRSAVRDARSVGASTTPHRSDAGTPRAPAWPDGEPAPLPVAYGYPDQRAAASQQGRRVTQPNFSGSNLTGSELPMSPSASMYNRWRTQTGEHDTTALSGATPFSDAASVSSTTWATPRNRVNRGLRAVSRWLRGGTECQTVTFSGSQELAPEEKEAAMRRSFKGRNNNSRHGAGSTSHGGEPGTPTRNRAGPTRLPVLSPQALAVVEASGDVPVAPRPSISAGVVSVSMSQQQATGHVVSDELIERYLKDSVSTADATADGNSLQAAYRQQPTVVSGSGRSIPRLREDLTAASAVEHSHGSRPQRDPLSVTASPRASAQSPGPRSGSHMATSARGVLKESSSYGSASYGGASMRAAQQSQRSSREPSSRAPWAPMTSSSAAPSQAALSWGRDVTASPPRDHSPGRVSGASPTDRPASATLLRPELGGNSTGRLGHSGLEGEFCMSPARGTNGGVDVDTAKNFPPARPSQGASSVHSGVARMSSGMSIDTMTRAREITLARPQASPGDTTARRHTASGTASMDASLSGNTARTLRSVTIRHTIAPAQGAADRLAGSPGAARRGTKRSGGLSDVLESFAFDRSVGLPDVADGDGDADAEVTTPDAVAAAAPSSSQTSRPPPLLIPETGASQKLDPPTPAALGTMRPHNVASPTALASPNALTSPTAPVPTSPTSTEGASATLSYHTPRAASVVGSDSISLPLYPTRSGPGDRTTPRGVSANIADLHPAMSTQPFMPTARGPSFLEARAMETPFEAHDASPNHVSPLGHDHSVELTSVLGDQVEAAVRVDLEYLEHGEIMEKALTLFEEQAAVANEAVRAEIIAEEARREALRADRDPVKAITGIVALAGGKYFVIQLMRLIIFATLLLVSVAIFYVLLTYAELSIALSLIVIVGLNVLLLGVLTIVIMRGGEQNRLEDLLNGGEARQAEDTLASVLPQLEPRLRASLPAAGGDVVAKLRQAAAMYGSSGNNGNAASQRGRKPSRSHRRSARAEARALRRDSALPSVTHETLQQSMSLHTDRMFSVNADLGLPPAPGGGSEGGEGEGPGGAGNRGSDGNNGVVARGIDRVVGVLQRLPQRDNNMVQMVQGLLSEVKEYTMSSQQRRGGQGGAGGGQDYNAGARRASMSRYDSRRDVRTLDHQSSRRSQRGYRPGADRAYRSPQASSMPVTPSFGRSRFAVHDNTFYAHHLDDVV